MNLTQFIKIALFWARFIEETTPGGFYFIEETTPGGFYFIEETAKKRKKLKKFFWNFFVKT